MLNPEKVKLIEIEANKRISQTMNGGHCSMMTMFPADVLELLSALKRVGELEDELTDERARCSDLQERDSD